MSVESDFRAQMALQQPITICRRDVRLSWRHFRHRPPVWHHDSESGCFREQHPLWMKTKAFEVQGTTTPSACMRLWEKTSLRTKERWLVAVPVWLDAGLRVRMHVISADCVGNLDLWGSPCVAFLSIWKRNWIWWEECNLLCGAVYRSWLYSTNIWIKQAFYLSPSRYKHIYTVNKYIYCKYI